MNYSKLSIVVRSIIKYIINNKKECTFIVHWDELLKAIYCS